MNPSDWRKAAALVSQHKQEAAMAEMDQLHSMPLSKIAIDDIGLPVVHYGSHMPVAASTPMGTISHLHSSPQEDSYQEIIPGIPQGSLYPTISSLSSGLVASDTNAQSLSNKVTKGLDQYLQDTEQLRASETNYFDDTVRPTNISPMSEMEEQVNQTSQNNLLTAKQEFIDETESAINIPEYLKTDTSHPLQWQAVPNSTSHHGIDLAANLQHDQLQAKKEQDPKEQDTIVHNADVFHDDCDCTAIDTIADGTTIQLEKPVTELFPTDDVTIPNEKVGCVFVTICLQQFLEEYPPPSDKQAFLDTYHMLSLLDKYLYDNPKQNIHCMSPNNEYVALLKYAIHLNIDISTFPTVWAVLSILLDTQDGNLEYVKLLQEEYNRYYESRSRKYMKKLEKKSMAIWNHMHDSVTHHFGRVSDYSDNGSTPLQGQQDEQPEAVNSAENAVAVDILTEYPSWSTDTHDICDDDEVIYDRNRKEIQDELCKDTPVKTEDNKPYIGNIDAYNRDRALITQPLSDRLGLGQNSLLGAQQVREATKHTNQMRDIPDHLRQISLGEETESTSYEERDRNRHIIPQVDGTVDSRDSLNQTPNSIDLTVSPVKYRNAQRDTKKINEDTNDNDIDEMVKFNKDKAREVYRKDTNEQRDMEKTDENINDDTYQTVKANKDRTTKVYEINTEERKILNERREKALQNAKDRKAEKVNAQAALQANTRSTKASKIAICLHILIEKLDIQAKLRYPQNIELQLQNLH